MKLLSFGAMLATFAMLATPAAYAQNGRSRATAVDRPGPTATGAASEAPKDGETGAPREKSASSADQPHLPPPAFVHQSARIGGREVSYTAGVGALPVKDEKGKVVAEVVVTSYIVDGPRDPSRPITFAFNGGPGAASVYLNMGAIGPKRVQFGADGDSPSDPARLLDNAGSWLDFTDLVFIDPVGTGFSRSYLNEDETKKKFYAVKPDIDYLSRIVYDWLLKNGRLMSPKYVVGESYGGFRGPRITHTLQTDLGVGVNGLILVSPLLDSASRSSGDISPLPWMATLPSIAAANLERKGQLTPAAMKAVMDYARGDYLRDLMAGKSDPGATERVIKKVTELTALDPAFVRRSGGRLETQAYLREVFRSTGKLGSRYDSNVTAFDPFPYDPDQRPNDPILDAIIAPTTTAMVDWTTRVVGWKVEARYEPLSNTVNRLWDRGRGRDTESVTDLREAVAIDPKLRVLIVHGWNDLSCPFFPSVLIADQIPSMGGVDRVQVKEYAGGHMFYSRPDSQQAMRKDVMALYGAK
ncbi:S10 family peptidase [soil metagenome]